MHSDSGLCNGFVQSKNRFVRSGAAGQRKYDNRRFPPPWAVEELNACFVVRDNSGQKLAYVYFEDEPGPGAATVDCVTNVA
jgi:hypothetical protein